MKTVISKDSRFKPKRESAVDINGKIKPTPAAALAKRIPALFFTLLLTVLLLSCTYEGSNTIIQSEDLKTTKSALQTAISVQG